MLFPVGLGPDREQGGSSIIFRIIMCWGTSSSGPRVSSNAFALEN